MDTKMKFDRESMIARAVVKIKAALEQEKQEHYEPSQMVKSVREELMDTKMKFDRESMIARAVVKIEAALEQEKQEHTMSRSRKNSAR